VYNCFKNTVCGSERRIVLKHVMCQRVYNRFKNIVCVREYRIVLKTLYVSESVELF